METNKIIGYILLAVGLLLIIAPLWQTFNIMTGKYLPPQVFMKPIALTVNDKVSALDIGGQIQNALVKAVPIDFIDNTLNLGTWLLLMWILIYGGGKVSDIGVKLIK